MKPFDPRLLRAVPTARRPVAALGALGVIAGIATIATAFAIAAVIVAVVGGAPLTTGLLWLGAIFVVRAGLAGASEWVAAWSGVTVSTALRSALLRRWGDLDEGSRPEPSRAVALATGGASAVEPYAAKFLPTLVTAAVVPVLAIGTLLVVDWRSALVVILTLPLLPVFAALIGKATAESTERRWSALAALSGHFLDVVRGLPTLVGYGRARRQVETVRAVSERHRLATMETLRIAFLSSAALELLATISVAIVAVTVGLRLSHGSMELGPALIAILLAPEAYWPVRRVGAEYHSAADGAVALDEILTQLSAADVSPAGPGAPSGTPGEVRLAGVGFAYAAGSAPVVRDLDLVAGPGLTVVTGESGVGKSTLLDLVAGLRLPTGGTISAPPCHYVTQRPFLGAGTIRDALTLGHPASDAELWEALRAVEVDGVVAALDQGLSTTIGDDGFGLSAGQRQRLALARAWLSTETLLLLDEPTAHLDPEGAEQLARLVAEIAERRVVIAATHRQELLEHADQHVHLVAPHSAVEVIADATSVPASPRTGGWKRRGTSGAGSDGGGGGAGGDGGDPSPRRRPVWWPTAGTAKGGLLGGLATASGMALTATSGWLIVRASEMPVILTLLTAIVAVRAFGMARPLFRYWERLVSHDAALRLLADRRTTAYARLIPLTPARLGRRRRSDVLTGVVDDLTDAVDAQVRVTVPVISTLVAGALVIGITTLIAPPVGLVLTVLALVVGAIGGLAEHLESRSLGDLLAARAQVTQVSELMATQALELRAVGGWPSALRWLDNAHATLARVTRRVSLGRAAAAALFLIVVGAAVIVVAVIAQGLDVAAPVKALLALTPVAVSDAISPLVDAMRALARANESEQRIDDLLDLAPAVHDPATGTNAPSSTGRTNSADNAAADTSDATGLHLRTLGVTASWTGERTDLAPTDLDLPAGSTLAITGPNGSGKSTLLAVLARHLDPVAGSYLHDDVDVMTLPLDGARSHLAVVDDDTHVFATTLRANLALAAPAADDATIETALADAGLATLTADLPDGLDTVLGSGGRGVSGGQRTRLGIARALLSRRPVVLLDEPVAHLDPPTARSVVADLTRVAGISEPPRTLVMVTHRDEGVDLFERTISLHHPGSTLHPENLSTDARTATADDDRSPHQADPPRR